MRKEWIVRWSFFIVGLIVLALGVAMTIKGKLLGIGPWDVFHYGLTLQFGLTIGTWIIIVGFFLLLITVIFTKKMPKIGAFLNMILMGFFIDFFLWILPNTNSLAGSALYLLIGVIIVGYGIGIYVSAELGAGPRDGLMILIVEKTGWKVQWVRNGMELSVLLIGWLMGGPVGIGTVIVALLIGPIVGFSLPQCKTLLHFILYRKQSNKLAI